MFKLEPETKSGSNLQITEVTNLPLISPRGTTYIYMLPVTGRRGDTSGYRQLSYMHAVKRKKILPRLKEVPGDSMSASFLIAWSSRPVASSITAAALFSVRLVTSLQN